MASNALRSVVSRAQDGTGPTRFTQESIPELVASAATGLVPMLDPQEQLFCFRLNRTPHGLKREGLSYRYTIMSLLGLHRFEAGGRRSSPIRMSNVLDRVLANVDWVDNIGDLGLVVWLCAVTSPERLEEVYSRLDVKRALERFRGVREGLTMELAWFLSGLAHAAQAPGPRLPELTRVAVQAHSLLSANQGQYGIFGHLAKNGSVVGALRGRIGSFADQVYPIYALAKFGQAFENSTALESARSCAAAICQAQGPLGQWWWHYDSLTGRVFQRYPVYAVHQHGMAPMSLFALGDATRLDFSESIYKGLAWIDGNNEMDSSLRETSSSIVWRSIYRRNGYKRYFREFMDFLLPTDQAVSADDLRMKFECRPYELGWLLYAFAGRDRD